MGFDVITMGRISVDIYPQQVGVSLREVESFGKFLGGSSTNVAVAAARYGRDVATITRTGNDPFGLFLHDALQGFGVDDRWVTAVDGLPTPLAFCEIFPPDDFPLYFYREPKAPDLEIRTDELDLDAIRDAKVFWATVTGLSQEPSRSATLAALEASEGITVLDLDWRPMFWASREEGRKWVREALRFADVAVGNEDEWETAGEADVALTVRKRGPRGTFAQRGDRVRRRATRARRGRQRPRGGRRLRWRALPRPARRLGPGADDPLRQCRGRDRRRTARLRRRHAHRRRSRGQDRCLK